MAWEFLLEDFLGRLLVLGWQPETAREHWEFVASNLVMAGLGIVLAGVAYARVLARQNRVAGEAVQQRDALELAIEGTSDAVFLKNLDGKYIFVNEAACRAVGRKRRGVLGRTDAELFPPGVVAEYSRTDGEVLKTGRPLTFEVTFTMDDQARAFRITKSPYRNEAGEIVGITGIARDITDQRTEQAVVAASEERYRSIFETSPDGIVIGSLDGTIHRANDAFLALVGYTADEITRLSYRDLTPVRWHDMEREILDRLLDTGEAEEFEKELRRKDGASVPVRIRVWRLDDAASGSYLMGRVRDLSEFRRVEAELHRQSRIIEQVSDPVVVADLEGKISGWNKGAEWLFEYRPEEAVGQPAAMLYADETQVLTDEDVQLHAGSNRGQVHEALLKTRSGKLVESEVSLSLLSGRDGQPFGLVCHFRDLTRLREMAHAAEELATEQKIILDNAGVGILFLKAGKIHRHNPKYAEIMGYGSESMEGLPGSVSFSGAGDHQEFLDTVLPALSQGKTHVLERELKSRDGTMRLCKCTGRAVDPADPDKGRIWLIEDITYERQIESALREGEQRLSGIVENLVDGLITISDKGIIEGVNGAGEGIFGYPAEEIVGKNISVLMPEPDRSGHDGYLANYMNTGDAKIIGIGRQVLGRRKDGGVFPMDLAVSEITVGGKRKFAGIVRDITDRKRAERELRQARDEAEAANAAKSEFLSSMSHELRTPLNSIMGYGQLLSLARNRELDKNQREAVDSILTGGQQLLSLIDAVLDLSTIEAGKVLLNAEAVNVEQVAGESLDMIRGMAGDAKVRINSFPGGKSPPPVLADSFRLKQVLLNLITNAVKYNRPGGSVSLSWESVEDARLRIHVSDTGLGIARELQSHIFEPFSRLGHENSEIEGTGIGLTITKQLVEMMDGAMGFESTPGEGSNFWCDFPIADEDAAAKLAGASGNGAGGIDWNALEGQVLYIEDSPSNLHLMKSILDQFPNLELLTAPDLELGLRMAREHRPMLILLDINLPGMDGYQALKELRRSAATKSIPVIAVSAKAMPRDVARGREAGFEGYLTKPVDVKQLVETIRRLG